MTSCGWLSSNSDFKMRADYLFVVLSLLVARTIASNVLFLNGATSPSHHIFNRGLVLGLAQAGHNVTFVSTDISKEPRENVHYIHLEKAYLVYAESMKDQGDFDIMSFMDQGVFAQLTGFHDYIKISCDGVLASDDLDVILNYPSDFKFDVVLHDFTFGPCLLPLIHRFDYPPLIAVTAFSNPPYSTISIGGIKYPSYIPHYLLNYPMIMSLSQRIFNTFVYATDLM